MPNNTLNAVINTPKVAKAPVDRTKLGWKETFKLMMFESTKDLEKKKLDALKELAASQAEISFLNQLRSMLMVGANNDGSFDVTEQFQALLNKMSNPGSESLMGLLDELGLKFTAKYTPENFNNLFTAIDSLPKEQGQAIWDKLSAIGIQRYPPPPTQEQLDAIGKLVLSDENIGLRKLLIDNKILGTKDKFTKAERESLIESINVNVGQKQSIHNTKSQMTMHYQTLIHQMQQGVPDMAKTLKRIIDKMNDNLKRS